MKLCKDARTFQLYVKQQQDKLKRGLGSTVRILNGKCALMQHIKGSEKFDREPCPDCKCTDKEIKEITGLPVAKEWLDFNCNYLFEKGDD